MTHQERLEFIQMTQTLAARVVELSERLESAREEREEMGVRIATALQLLNGARSAKAAAAAEVLKGNCFGHPQS